MKIFQHQFYDSNDSANTKGGQNVINPFITHARVIDTLLNLQTPRQSEHQMDVHKPALQVIKNPTKLILTLQLTFDFTERGFAPSQRREYCRCQQPNCND